MAGIDVAHVPYKGTPEAIADTIAGRVCCYFAPINAALPHIKGGKAVALAVTSAQRSSLLPDVPTIAESGVPGFDYTLWVGLWGPAAMPAALVNKINADVNRALESPDLAQRLTNLGTLPMKMSPAQFNEYVRREVEDTAKVLKAAGIKPQ
jgi:tripartite-type tricarboxylate transporter receptor subunit TctC